jgi:hypothetical protein
MDRRSHGMKGSSVSSAVLRPNPRSAFPLDDETTCAITGERESRRHALPKPIRYCSATLVIGHSLAYQSNSSGFPAAHLTSEPVSPEYGEQISIVFAPDGSMFGCVSFLIFGRLPASK